MYSRIISMGMLTALVFHAATVLGDKNKPLLAGAAVVNVSPESFPVIVNGGFLEATASAKIDEIHARAIVLDDSKTRLALVVVDSCMMARDFLDVVKKDIFETTRIPEQNIMISATHTHSAPSVMGTLGARPDEKYRIFLGNQIVRAVTLASKNLVPAKVGCLAFKDAEHTHCRRWIYQPDKMLNDPFGKKTVRANMHPGHLNPNVVGPSGPVDPEFTLLSIKSYNDKTIAVLANYSMHYYGSGPVSSDYYGPFCATISKLIQGSEKGSNPVAIMSQGTSGDLMWMDYGKAAPKRDMNAYAANLANNAFKSLQGVTHRDDVTLGMIEKRIKLKRRIPDTAKLEWASGIINQMKSPVPKNRDEVYAKEQFYLKETPEVELKLQAIRIGDLGITAIPNEVFGITGLKLKEQSPLPVTMNIELANGSEGYIPPPEQHALGGYTTWPARTAALEVQAEPLIVRQLLENLEIVSQKARKTRPLNKTEYSDSILALNPLAYWRFEDIEGDICLDASNNGNHGKYKDGKAFYLPGPQSERFGRGSVNRSVHFAGGSMMAKAAGLGNSYTVEGWIWNGLPMNARTVTGYFFSKSNQGAKGALGDNLGLGGSGPGTGKLIFFNGNEANQLLIGKTELPMKTWAHFLMIRDSEKVQVYLNGELDLDGIAAQTSMGGDLVIGGRTDGLFGWEGKVDEFAIYSKALNKNSFTNRSLK